MFLMKFIQEEVIAIYTDRKLKTLSLVVSGIVKWIQESIYNKLIN